jgi:hypothetical protein
MPLIVVEVAQRFCQRLHVRFAIAATDLWPNPFGPGAYTPIVTKHAAAASSLLCFTIINDPSFRLANWQTGISKRDYSPAGPSGSRMKR